jgi:PKD repeat protein
VTINWGDGTPILSLGAVSGEQPIAHVFSRAGTYIISLNVTDVAGSTSPVSTAVTVIPVPRPTIIVTPTPQSTPGGGTVTFNIRIDAPSGLAITNVQIDFGDGQTQSFGGATGNITTTHPYAAGPRTVVVTVSVQDSTGQTTIGTATVSITT